MIMPCKPRVYPAPSESSGNGPQQARKEFTSYQPFSRTSTEPLQFVYLRNGNEVKETREVPCALMHALTNPGESSLGHLQAMRELAQFYNEKVTPELDSVVLTGIGSVPAAILSSWIQASYRKHAVLAADAKEAGRGLFLASPEVDRCLRTVAALATGKSFEDVQKVAPEKLFLWVTKTVIEIETNVNVKMRTKRLTCDRHSHKEEIDVSVPDDFTVAQEQKTRDQRLASLPKMKDALDLAFGKIGAMRGEPLDSAERNAVVAHLNVTYIENPKDRLSVIL